MEGIGIERYAGLIDGEMFVAIQRAARSIYGLRVLNINSTFHGGGVAGMLNSLIPLMNDVGINSDWSLLYGDPSLFALTKQLHNGLQGEAVELTEEGIDAYLAVNQTFALYSPLLHDIVVVHDPQPLPMIRFSQRENPWIWRCHIDLSSPYPQVLDLLSPFILRYDASVVSSEMFIRPKWPMDTNIIAPAIDPFSEINREMTPEEIGQRLRQYGLDGDKPMLVQVSRFDKWKDPLGVIEVFRRVKQDVDCRLVLLGNMATDDPEGPEIFAQVSQQAEKLDDVVLITQTDPLLVNALQRSAAVVLQMSKREGFGLTVSEALWKRTPVVASLVGGIPLQIVNGKMGYLVQPQAYDDAAKQVLKLLRDPEHRQECGEAGREHVRKNFLIPRLLLDWLKTFKELV